MELPKNLIEATRYFADLDRCVAFVASYRWPDGVECPHCKCKSVGYLKSRRIYKCRLCRKQFSVKVGTIMEDSPIALDKWLIAIWMITNAKNGISSYEIARHLTITQKSAWFLLHRIRHAMRARSFEKKLQGEVEADETYVGGCASNMHKSKRARMTMSDLAARKAIVFAVLERRGEVRSRVVESSGARSLQHEIKKNVETGASVYTDELGSYKGLSKHYVHQFVNHTHEYVRGRVHTNGLENFFSLLKRGLYGTYINVDPLHLDRYVDEQAFRYNNRKMDDPNRFARILKQVSGAGKRLTWKGLVGEPLEGAVPNVAGVPKAPRNDSAQGTARP